MTTTSLAPASVVIFERALPPEACALAMSFHEPSTTYNVEHQVGGFYADPEPTATWLDADNPDHALLFEIMVYFASQAAPLLGVSDLGVSATVKILEYCEGQRLGAHVDTAPGAESNPARRAEVLGRTVSLMAQLHDGDQYEGGDLILTPPGGQKTVAPRSAGTLTIYRSDVTHKVTRIRSGVRLCSAGFFSTAPGADWG